MIHKYHFLEPVALSPGIQHENILQKTNGKTTREIPTHYLQTLHWCHVSLD